MALQSNRKKSIKKPLAIIITVIMLLGLGYTVYAWQKDAWPFANNIDEAKSTTDVLDDESIDTSPATDEDQDLANEKKQEAYEQQQKQEESKKSSSGTGSQQKVSVTLTTFYKEDGEIHANGFVAGVIENGGTCTLILTNQDGKSVSTTRKGHVNATNTTCGQSTVKLSQLSPGKWTPELHYSSGTSTGTTGPNAWEAIEVN